MPAVIAFDLDGTVVDCKRRQVAVAEAVAVAFHMSFSPTAFWSAKRAGATTEQAFIALGVPAAKARAAAWSWRQQIEFPEWLLLDTVLPGVPTVPRDLVERGWSPVLLTARSDPEAARDQVDRLGLGRLFAEVVVVSPPLARREKATALREMRARALVGDSESDASAAAAAGSPFAAVGTGQRSPAFLRTHGVPVVHRSLVTAVAALGLRRRSPER